MDELEKELINLSDEEKLLMIKIETEYHYIRLMILTLKNEELKLKLSSKLKDNDRAILIEKLNSDELKIEYLKQIKSYSYLEVNIAISIKSDKAKMEIIDLFENEIDKKRIIESLKLDKNKIEAMKKYTELSDFYAEIAMTLKLTENKIKCLMLLHDWSYKVSLVENILIENDEQRLLIVELVDDDYIACNIILEMQKEVNKVKALKFLKGEETKEKVILTLSKKSRLQLLNQLENSKNRDPIDKPIPGNESKKRSIEQIGNEENSKNLIISLKNDQDKLKNLDRIKNSQNRALIEMSLEDREKLKEFFLREDRSFCEIGLNKDITIGIEIETEGEKSKDLVHLKELLKRRKNNISRGWKTEDDVSLNEGVEAISPIMTDNKEDVEDIYMICEMLKRCGQEANEHCGGHIHIGADYLTSKEAYANLFEIFGNAERIIYLISNEEGNIPRKGIERYAESISYKLNNSIEKGSINLEEEDLNVFIEKIKEAQVIRNSGINLLNVNNSNNTIEFRVPNGTINPNVWIQNIRLFGRIVEISQRLAQIEKKGKISKENLRLIELREKLKEEIPEQDKVEILLKLLFSEKERDYYRKRYIVNSKLLRDLEKVENPFEYIKFERVDFRKRHSISEVKAIARSGRSSDFIIAKESSNLDIEK